MIQNHSLQKKGQKMETRMRGKIANIWFYNLPCDSKSREIGDADWYSILSQVWNQNPSIPSSSSAGMWFQHVSTPQKHMNHSDHPKPFLGMANYKTKPGCFFIYQTSVHLKPKPRARFTTLSHRSSVPCETLTVRILVYHLVMSNIAMENHHFIAR